MHKINIPCVLRKNRSVVHHLGKTRSKRDHGYCSLAYSLRNCLRARLVFLLTKYTNQLTPSYLVIAKCPDPLPSLTLTLYALSLIHSLAILSLTPTVSQPRKNGNVAESRSVVYYHSRNGCEAPGPSGREDHALEWKTFHKCFRWVSKYHLRCHH